MNNPLRRDCLLSMVSGALIWAVYFLLSYLLVSLICFYGYAESRLLGLNLTVLGVGLLTLVALGFLIYTAAINYRHWQWRRAQGPAADTAIASDAFIAFQSLLLCLLAIIAVIWVAIPTLLLPPCAG